MVQVGIITVSGRQVGIVTQAVAEPDTTMPILDDGSAPDLGAGAAYGGPQSYSDDVSRPSSGHRGGHHSRDTGSQGQSASRGDDAARKGEDLGSVPYSTSGNPFDRSRFAKELEQKPWLREKIHQLAAGEDRPSGGESRRANMAVMETMMNRAVVRGTSLEQQAKWYGREKGGYYAGKPSTLSPVERANSEANLRQVLAGSNITNYATDNSSQGLAAREKASGSFRHHTTIHGESFFSPGHAEPALRDKWQALNRQATEFEKNQTSSVAASKMPDDL